MRKESEALINKLGHQDRVQFLGIRIYVHQLLKTTDICILSSKWEVFGLTAVEGMASGNLFITTDVLRLAEIVEGGGILFPLGE